MQTIHKKMLFPLIVALLSFVVIIYSVYEYQKTNADTIQQTQAQVNQDADNAVKQMSEHLQYIMSLGENLGSNLTNGKLKYPDVVTTLREIAIKNHADIKSSVPKFYSLRVAFAKGIYDPTKPSALTSFGYYYDPVTNELKLNDSEGYDYTIKDLPGKETLWFTRAVETRQPFWQEPRFGNNSDEFLIAYSVPFFTSTNKEQVAGVVTINLSIDDIKSLLYAQNYRRTGYSMVVSEHGKLIYHPDRLVTLAAASNGKDKYYEEVFEFLHHLKEDYLEDPTKIIRSHIMPITHKKAWIVFKTIPIAHWNMYIVLFESELHLEQKVIPACLRLVIAGVIFVIALAMIFLKQRKQITRQHYWYFSTSSGLALCLGVACLWYLADTKEFKLAEHSTMLISSDDVTRYKNQKNAFFKTIHQPEPYYIPTGVFIKSTEFEGANNLIISGYLWQKYKLDGLAHEIPADFCTLETDTIPRDKGLRLSESTEDKIDFSCSDATYKMINAGEVTLGWYFKVELREPFDYSNYPLDKNLIWMRMLSNSFSERIILVPDLRAYPYIFETAYFGLDRNSLVLPTWNVLGTFFNYQSIHLNANFGINGYVGQTADQLLFNIAIKRNFLDAFISTVIPICLIYLILFVVLFSTLEELLAVLAINAGLLFSVALWHSSLRASLASSGITYFETFYFVCYLVISLVSINSVLLSDKVNLRFIRYENNLIPKLVFFPFVSLLTFMITLITFFGH